MDKKFLSKHPHSSPKNKQASSSIKQKCVDSCFQYYTTHAIWILIQHSGGQVNMKQLQLIHRTAFHTSKLIKPGLIELYDQLLNCSAKTLHKKFLKLRNSTYEEMSDKIYDIDYTHIYKVLKFMVENYHHLHILKTFTVGVDLTKIDFEIDIISHNVYKREKK